MSLLARVDETKIRMSSLLTIFQPFKTRKFECFQRQNFVLCAMFSATFQPFSIVLSFWSKSARGNYVKCTPFSKFHTQRDSWRPGYVQGNLRGWWCRAHGGGRDDERAEPKSTRTTTKQYVGTICRDDQICARWIMCFMLRGNPQCHRHTPLETWLNNANSCCTAKWSEPGTYSGRRVIASKNCSTRIRYVLHRAETTPLASLQLSTFKCTCKHVSVW